VAAGSLSIILSIVTHHPQPPEHYKRLIADLDEVAHVTVEVHRCEGESCRKPAGIKNRGDCG